jgi:predicted transcriptional regulator
MSCNIYVLSCRHTFISHIYAYRCMDIQAKRHFDNRMKVTPRQLRHRSRSEVISSILEATNGNKLRIAEIQFKAYLSYNILKEYLVHLLQCDLIEYIEGERTFKTTPKGMQVLQKYNKMEELFVKTH